MVDDLGHQELWSGCAGAHAHTVQSLNPGRVDIGGLGSCLGEVDRALTVLDDDKQKAKAQAKAKAKAGTQGQPDSIGKPKTRRNN